MGNLAWVKVALFDIGQDFLRRIAKPLYPQVINQYEFTVFGYLPK